MLPAGSLVVVLVSVTYTTACLTDCVCGQIGRYYSVMICSDLEWTDIPANLSTALEAVDFSNNQIELLEGDVFQGMQSLKSVELQYNSVQELPVGIFNDAEQLEVLDLSFNSIEVLPQEVFKHNGRLKELYLKQNPLSTPSGSTPLLSSNSLSVLDISFCGITDLWAASLSSVRNLKHLNIVGNNITSLRADVVKPLWRLKRLEMSIYETDCTDASTRETVKYLREQHVVVSPPELCIDDLHVKSVRSVSKTTSKSVDTESSKNESQAREVKTTLSDVVVLGSVLDGRRRNVELRGILLTNLVSATCVLLVALFFMSVVVVLVRRGKQRGKKPRPPMPLPERLQQDRQPDSQVYTALSGSLHEYARPVLPDQEHHYCEVRAAGDDGYLLPRPPAAVHVGVQPLLGRPVYCPTTAPVPDVIGHLRAVRSYMRVPPRPSFCT